MDPHMQLGVWESMKDPALICLVCRKEAQGSYSIKDAGQWHPLCDACVEADEKGSE
jgi:hypothetical protein